MTLYDVKTTEFVVVLRSERIGTNRLILPWIGSCPVGIMVAYQHVKLDARVQFLVQDRISLFQIYKVCLQETELRMMVHKQIVSHDSFGKELNLHNVVFRSYILGITLFNFLFTIHFRALKIIVYNYLKNKITVFKLTDNTHHMLFFLTFISLHHLPLIKPHKKILNDLSIIIIPCYQPKF